MRATPSDERAARYCGLSARSRFAARGVVVIDQVLQLLAGLEVGDTLGGHFHPRAGLGIAPDAGLPLACAETAKPAYFDLVPAAQGLDDTIEDCLDNNLRILPCHFDDARDFLDQFGLGHYRSSPFPRMFIASSIVIVTAAACRW